MGKFSRAWKSASIAILIGCTAACHLAESGATRRDTSDAKLRDGSGGENWSAFGRTYGEQHFSPLADINEENVGQLGLVWSHDLGPGHSATGPIEVDGVIYVANRQSFINAIDAKTGKELWAHDTGAAQRAGHRMRQAWGSRGIAWWNGKVYTGTVDGRLVALDAKTGKELWSVNTVSDDNVRYITGAPRAFDGKIIIGHGGGDSGPIRGYVTTYDAETGKQLWRFYVAPGQPGVDKDETTRIAAKTWAGEWWKFGGGGAVWNAITYDAATDTVFLGTGQGYPWNHRVRSQGKGDNLFLCSIVALSGRTGAYKWHYQVNPGDTWDYDAAMDMELADLDINGKSRKVLVSAPKNGFFYVIDRTTGKLLSARPFVDKVNWASHIDITTGRPVENPEARFPNGHTILLWPGVTGGHSWLPMAYNPLTHLVFIPTIETSNTYSDKGIDLAHWAPTPGNVFDGAQNIDFDVRHGGPTDFTSYLQAYDPVVQKRVWRVRTPGMVGGGVAATAGGLIFEGQLDGRFNAYAARSGKLLWSFDAGSPIIAPPITYSLNGRQYVTVVTGHGTSFGGYGKMVPFTIDYRTQAHDVLTFAIGGKAKLPPREKTALQPRDDKSYRSDAASATRGLALAGAYCIACHGFDLVGGGTAPDLRASSIPLDAASFRSVVHDGALVPNGMPRFEELTDQQLADVRQYIRQEAHDWRQSLALKGLAKSSAP